MNPITGFEVVATGQPDSKHSGATCKKVSEAARSLQIHQPLSHDEVSKEPSGPEEKKTFPCSYCPRTFKAIQSLSLHQLSHRGSMACEICYKVFKSGNALGGHMARAHPGLGKKSKGPASKSSLSGMVAKRKPVLASTASPASSANKTLVVGKFWCDHCCSDFPTQMEAACHVVTHFSKDRCQLLIQKRMVGELCFLRLASGVELGSDGKRGKSSGTRVI